jgi:hypothetical protein
VGRGNERPPDYLLHRTVARNHHRRKWKAQSVTASPKPRSKSKRKMMWAVPWRSYGNRSTTDPAVINSAWRMFGFRPSDDELKSLSVKRSEVVRVYVRIWRKP